MSLQPGFTESLILLVFMIMAIISTQLFRNKNGIKLSNKILGILFLLLSLQIFLSYLTVTNLITKPIFRVIDDTLLLGVGPLLLLYSRVTIDEKGKLQQRDVLHFIPLLALLIPFFFFMITSSHYSEWLLGVDLSEVLKNISKEKFQLIIFLMLSHINVYLIISFIVALRHRSKHKTVNYQWVIYTLLSFQVVNIASYLQVFRPYLFLKVNQSFTFDLILFTLLAFLITVLLKGMSGSPLFSELKRSKYQNSKLGDHEKNDLKQKLERIIYTDQLYLEANITVKKLSELINAHPKKVSQVINELFGRSFYDLMNYYRVNHAIDLLSDDSNKKLTVSEIQYKSGFNSKSSFHTQFKKQTGVSPKEFRSNI